MWGWGEMDGGPRSNSVIQFYNCCWVRVGLKAVPFPSEACFSSNYELCNWGVGAGALSALRLLISDQIK